jgi:hypothetical protein
METAIRTQMTFPIVLEKKIPSDPPEPWMASMKYSSRFFPRMNPELSDQ